MSVVRTQPPFPWRVRRAARRTHRCRQTPGRQRPCGALL